MGGIFGGKGSAPAPPPVAEPPRQEMNELMMQMMSMMGHIGGPPPAPEVPLVPSIIREPETDWTEKSKELAAKAKADYSAEAANKKGRMATILTSPLLDDEATTTGSLLGGVTK